MRLKNDKVLTEKKIHTIKSYDDFEWCRLRLLQAESLND